MSDAEQPPVAPKPVARRRGAEDSKERRSADRRRDFLLLGILVAVVGGGIWVARSRDAAPPPHVDIPREALGVAYARLATCLAGAPLTGQESARGRLRNVWLATERVPRSAGAEARAAGWPTRCAQYAEQLVSVAEPARGQDPKLDRVALAALGARLSLGQGELPRSADELWEAAAAMGLAHVLRDDVPRPAEPQSPLRADELRVFGAAGTHVGARLVIAPTPDALLVGPPFVSCAFPSLDGRVTARCVNVAEPVRATVNAGAMPSFAEPFVWLREADAPAVLSLGASRLVLPDGELRAGFGAAVPTVVVRRADGLFAARLGAEATDEVKLTDGHPPVSLVSPTAAVVLAESGDHDALRAFELDVAGGLRAARTVELGDVQRSVNALSVCARGDEQVATSAVLATADVVDGRMDAALAVRLQDARGVTWRSAVATRVGAIEVGFVCRTDGADLTWVERDVETADAWTLVHVRCVAESCVEESGTLTRIPRRPVVTTVGDEVLVVWHSGAIGGVHVRLGSVSEVCTARDTWLVDETTYGGVSIAALEVVSTPDLALLLLESDDGVRGVAVGADGDAQPIRVR